MDTRLTGRKLRLYDWVRQRIPEGSFVDMTFVAELEELVCREIAHANDSQGSTESS